MSSPTAGTPCWARDGLRLDDLLTDGRFACRVLDERKDSARHEPCGAHGGATSGDLGNLDDASAGRDLDATPVARRLDLVDSNLATGVDDDLDPITSHAFTLTRGERFRRSEIVEGVPRAEQVLGRSKDDLDVDRLAVVQRASVR